MISYCGRIHFALSVQDRETAYKLANVMNKPSVASKHFEFMMKVLNMKLEWLEVTEQQIKEGR